jgi:fibro-slime domain-containing protein
VGEPTGGTPSLSEAELNPEEDLVSGFNESCGSNLNAIIRDFSPSTHPDFEIFMTAAKAGGDPEIVGPLLGEDKKPVYTNGTKGTTSGPENFWYWFNDDTINPQPVNMPLPDPYPIPFREEADPNTGATYSVFDASVDMPGGQFFPIDDQLFGNEGNAHNFHFTLEFHTVFQYDGVEQQFTFVGDDDVWVFMNGHRVIDLGGIHEPEPGTFLLNDQTAAQLGMVPGQIYPLDFFFAERHTDVSNFRIQTNLVIRSCGIIL